MSTQTVTTPGGPKSRVERMHDHVNHLRTDPCRRGQHWYVPMVGDVRCERCDEPAPVFEKRWHRCSPTPFIVAVDPATPDEPPLIVTLRNGIPRQVERGYPPTPYVPPPLPTERRRAMAERFRDAMIDGRLFPYLDDLEPMDLTAPAKHLIRVTSPTWIPVVPAADIHPNGGIPG